MTRLPATTAPQPSIRGNAFAAILEYACNLPLLGSGAPNRPRSEARRSGDTTAGRIGAVVFERRGLLGPA